MNNLSEIFSNPVAATQNWDWQFAQLKTEYDADDQALICSMHPRPRPCFTPELLRDLQRYQDRVARAIDTELHLTGENSVKFLVHVSGIKDVFNLGGDLEFFLEKIRAQDHEGLYRYAHLGIDVLYRNLTNLAQPVVTVALLEGTALGAGFEAALSNDVVIAERQIQIGFPEVAFNMFPGMGAYSILARRIPPSLVERMILSGRLYTAEELYEMGLIDVLAEPGGARAALQTFIRKYRRTSVTRNALLRVRNRVNPISRDELIDIANLWVESALSLPPQDLRMMERLLRAQTRRIEPSLAASE